MKIIMGGSFRRFADEIFRAADRFARNHEIAGVERIVFPLVVLDEWEAVRNDTESVRLYLERERLMKSADLLYVVNPGGYVGLSTCSEIGRALALEKKIYCSDSPEDATIMEYVKVYGVDQI